MDEVKSFYEKLFKNAYYELSDIDLESTIQPHDIPKLDKSTSKILD